MNNGHKSTQHILDNEVSAEFVAVTEVENIAYQLAPPSNQNTNTTNVAVQTFTYHLLSGVASCHPDFTIQEWD